ncbi:MAG: hypothetical protein P4M08_09660 [Oligoflexia bacterium]|nr:hypothetical protein [Oligoflexia bacterium]
MSILVNGTLSASVHFANTGSWSSYSNAFPAIIGLPSGLVTLELQAQSSGFNLGGINVKPAGCAPITHTFSTLTNFTSGSTTNIGGQLIPYNSATYAFLRGLSYSSGLDPSFTRMAGYSITSNDCGMTWTRQSTQAHSTYSANGPLHFNMDPTASSVSQGFVSRYVWGWKMPSRIYNVLNYGTTGWGYLQDLSTTVPPLPAIGSTDDTRMDGFYSPDPVMDSADPARNILLYFGGGRATYTHFPIGQCPEYSWKPAVNDPENYLMSVPHQVCSCANSDNGIVGIDSCTGDKIFLATNEQRYTGSSNALAYRVYQGGGLWTANASDSSQFEPIISPAKVNQCWQQVSGTYFGAGCPLHVEGTNDPTVVRVTQSNGQTIYVMYFTGGMGPYVNTDWTHVAISTNGLDWNRFSILTAAPGVNMPGSHSSPGIKYNYSNGGVRAYYNSTLNTFTLVSIFAAEGDQANNPESGLAYLLQISGDNPSVVQSVKAFKNHSKDMNSWTQCSVGGSCDDTVPY